MNKTIKELDILISDGNYSSKYPRSNEFIENGIPFIRANNLVDGSISDEDMYYITPEKHSVLCKGHVKTGDVLITTRGNIGQVAIVPNKHDDSNINAQLVLLRTDNKKIYNRYLLWALQSRPAREQYLALQTGTALKQLPVGKLERLNIKITEIDKQHFIADCFDNIYEIIKDRRKELQCLDNLIKARFVEMFGDPINNDRQWKQITLLESLEEGRTVSYGIVQTGDDFEDGVPVFRPVDIAGGHIPKRSELKKTDPMISAQYKRTLLKGNELLITVRGSVGETFQTNEEFEGCNVGRNIVPLITNQSIINQRFLQELIATDAIKRWLKGITKGIALQGLNMGEFKEMPVIMPPIEEQRSFVRFAEQVDKSKVAVQKSLDEAQLLFDSLMQKYFG